MRAIVERRKTEEPDIVLGGLAIWIGTGEGMSWPWLDLAVRIGKGWDKIVDLHGPLVQRPDFLAFVPALRDFVERRRGDAALYSLGGSLRLTLRRSEYDSLYGELWLQHGSTSQTVNLPLWEEALPVALAGAEAVADRLTNADWGWRPTPEIAGVDPRLPRDSGVDEPESPAAAPLESWDAGLDASEDVAFDYTVDGYGWYGVEVRVGGKVGGFGGGYLTDPFGDLLRAGLLLLAGGDHAELTCNAEPGLTRVEFDSVVLGVDVAPPGPARRRDGCRIRIREIDHFTGNAADPEFDALCRSPRLVAEAIYAMALPHFRDGAGPWSDAMAALEGALAAVPREA